MLRTTGTMVMTRLKKKEQEGRKEKSKSVHDQDVIHAAFATRHSLLNTC